MYYGGYSGSTYPNNSALSIRTGTKNTFSGSATFNKDRTFIEEDTTFLTNTVAAGVNTVEKVKSVIADAVGTFKPGSNEHRRLLLANYLTDPSTATTNAVFYAADMGAITDQKSDLASSDNFNVIGIANIVGVADEALGTLNMHNLSNKSTDFV